MDHLAEEEISYLNTMIMMQENISSHLKLKHGLEFHPDPPVPTASIAQNELDTACEAVVAMDLMQINIEDCLCLIRVGDLLLKVVEDKHVQEQIEANVRTVSSYYWEAKDAFRQLKEDFELRQETTPILDSGDIHARIEEREELTAVIDAHLARLARDRSNEAFLLENLDKLKKKRESSVLWDLISN